MRRLLPIIFLLLSATGMAQVPAVLPSYELMSCRDLQTQLLEFDLSTMVPVVLGELNPEEYSVEFFAAKGDAVANINPIPTVYTATENTVAYVRMTEISTGEFVTGLIALFDYGNHYGHLPPDLFVYEEVYDGQATFDLAAQLDYFFPMQVSFYVSEADAVAQVNAIDASQPFVNTSNPQTIWAVMQNEGPGCYAMADFKLVVGEGIEPVLSFTDVNLKNKLLESDTDVMIAINVFGDLIKIDANDDGEIQVSEAQYIHNLRINNGNITSLEGLEGFSNLYMLNFNNNIVSAVDFTGLNFLQSVECSNNQLTSLDVSMLPLLRGLVCENNQLTSITGFHSVFQTLWCSGNPLTTVDISEAKWFSDIICSNTLITSLSLIDKPILFLLVCENTPLESLYVENLPYLATVNLVNTALTEVDFSGVPQLEAAVITDNPQLASINMKNGPKIISPEQSQFSNNPNLLYICVDEGEQEVLLENAEMMQLDPDIYMNTLCDETGGNFNAITGTISLDAGNNGCTSGSTLHNFVSISVNSEMQEGFAYTNNEGVYNFTTTTGTFTLTPQSGNDWFTVTPESATVTLESGGELATQNFCVVPNGVHPDLEVLLVPVVPAQPGFDAVYNLVYKNKGNQVLSGDLVLGYNDDVTDFVLATPAQTSSTAGNLNWEFEALQPFENRSVEVVFNVNSPMETPAVNNGDILNFTLTGAQETDETPADNEFLLAQEVIGSFDPNDITCIDGDMVDPSQIGHYLHYNINFENTGTAAATFIVVKQTINEAQFDISTLEMLYASHNVAVKAEGNVVEYRFDDIDLGPLEKGNIVFKMKTLSTLQQGDEVMQQAEIYFDYNWPIITNEAVTVFEELAGIGEFELDNTVKIYPNPVKDDLNITAGHDLKSIELYDLQGRLLQTALVNGTEATLNLNSGAAGVYFVKVTTHKGVKVEKIINE